LLDDRRIRHKEDIRIRIATLLTMVLRAPIVNSKKMYIVQPTKNPKEKDFAARSLIGD
jgi:hypothetical protein